MPQRFLRPGITNSERWNCVSFPAQSFYIRILTLVDDFGQYDARPAVLMGQCFQIWNTMNENEQISLQYLQQLLQELAASRLIEIRQTKSGKEYLQMVQWQERVRSGCVPKWSDGESGEIQLQQVAASCSKLQQKLQQKLLPPTPSPSPSPSPSPKRGEEEPPLFAPVRLDLYPKEYAQLLEAAKKAIKRLQDDEASYMRDLADSVMEVVVFVKDKAEAGWEQRVQELLANPANYVRTSLKPKVKQTIASWRARCDEIQRAMNGITR